MANLHLVTGHAGEPHVKATDDASLMQAIYGGDSVVLDRNNAFSCDVISNNLIRVNDGEALMQGRYIKMDKGNYVDLSIDNGHTGYRRIDVIAIEYSKDDTNIEEANLVVVKGSETQQEEATVPELIDGDTVDGSASTNQMALYHVKIDGLSITDVTQAYTVGQDFQTIVSEQNNKIETAENDIATLDTLTNPLKGTGAGFHSSIYRGKYLGSTYTNKQKEAIANGTFDDLFVGDYWRINGVKWRIADFDYYYNVGDASFNKHHVVIVPDTILYNAKMNSTNIATGAYTGSEMYTTNLDDARTVFDSAFGSSFIPTHRGMYSNAISDNNSSGWAWRDMRVELMSEEQVYGHSVWGVASHNGYDVGTQNTAFKLFTLDQTKIHIGQTYWLTNVWSSHGFALVNSYGNSHWGGSSGYYGVRPFACLVGE